MERNRRNKGPELLSKAADSKLQTGASIIVEALFDATVTLHDATAANLLVDLAEGAEYAENAALMKKVCSLAEKWLNEPQVGVLDTSPELPAPGRQLQLTSGEPDETPEAGEESESGLGADAQGDCAPASPGGAEEIPDAEVD